MLGKDAKFVVREAVYNGDSHLDEDNFYMGGYADGSTPVQLNMELVSLLGPNRYPLQSQFYVDLENAGKVKVLKHHQYYYPVIGNMYKPSAIAETPVAATLGAVVPEDLGLGGTEFQILMTDNLIKRFYIIESPNGTQLRVQKDPEPVGDRWLYTVVLANPTADAFCPAEDLQVGTRWIALWAPVSKERSRGTESTSVAPGKVQNQLGYMRKSMSWGDKRNHDRTMWFEVSTDKGKIKNWMSWFMYQFEKEWMNECEHQLWYSRYNRDADTGKINLHDALTNEPIPLGSGLLEQIHNYSTYSILTYDSLFNKIGDALFGLTDSDGMVITLYTGRGGIREFDRAMKEKGIELISSFENVADKFVVGEGRNLGLTGFFDHFYHIDGYLIQVKHNPVFDYGKKAQVSKRHPISGLPLESYRMVFVDTASVDGRPNIQYVSTENEDFQHATVLGMTNPPPDIPVRDAGSISDAAAPIRSSDINEGSYHRMKSGGLELKRGNRCFHLECVV